ncbi:hypothetical protein KIPB_011186, partial [Kipferlia bialata]|eukprot:g11186.t1
MGEEEITATRQCQAVVDTASEEDVSKEVVDRDRKQTKGEELANTISHAAMCLAAVLT